MNIEILIRADNGEVRLRVVYHRTRRGSVRVTMEYDDYKSQRVFHYDTPPQLIADVMAWIAPKIDERCPAVVMLSRQQISAIIAEGFAEFGRSKAEQVTGLPPREGGA